jgi:hypothetical protein
MMMGVENGHAVVVDGDGEPTKHRLAVVEVGIAIGGVGVVGGVVVGVVILRILVRGTEAA